MKVFINKRKLIGTIFILPSFFLHFLVIGLPATTLFYYGFTEWNGLGMPRFNGLNNLKRMIFDDIDFHSALVNNVAWTIFFLIVPVVIGLMAAMAVIRLKKTQMIFRTIFFLPYVVSGAVVGRIFSIFYSPYSGFASIFKSLGIDALADISVLADVRTALFAVEFADNWHWWGFVMVLFLAALHQVDEYLYEAADIEGANAWHKFWSVTVPTILPTIITIYMITIIGSFLAFDYVFIMTRGGPAGATEIASTWIYKRSFIGYEAGYGSFLSLTICILCIIVYFGFTKLQKKGLEV